MNRNLTCIVCPRGCALTIQGPEDGLCVTGNGCARGQEYAVNEVLHPVRTVTAAVRVANRADTMVCVKTETPVPKDRVLEVAALLRQITVDAPVELGQTIIDDVFDSRIIVTRGIS